jgi:hypothetical protein
MFPEFLSKKVEVLALILLEDLAVMVGDFSLLFKKGISSSWSR